MENSKSNRRNFLKLLGLTAGTTVISNSAFSSFVTREEILQLNEEQKEFMLEYETWMDAFIEVIRIQKKNPADMENQKRMIELTNAAEEFKPQLQEFMKDKTFSVVYQAAIERMSKEI